MGTQEELQEPLDAVKEIDGIQGAAIVRRDGLLVLSNFPQDVDAEQLAAMTASTMGAGETASETLSIGELKQVVLEAEDGKLVSTGAGENGILTVLTGDEVNMGLILVEMRKASKKIKKAME